MPDRLTRSDDAGVVGDLHRTMFGDDATDRSQALVLVVAGTFAAVRALVGA